MKDKAGNTGSLEYNQAQSSCTKPNTRGELWGECETREKGEKVIRGWELKQVMTTLETTFIVLLEQKQN